MRLENFALAVLIFVFRLFRLRFTCLFFFLNFSTRFLNHLFTFIRHGIFLTYFFTFSNSFSHPRNFFLSYYLLDNRATCKKLAHFWHFRDIFLFISFDLISFTAHRCSVSLELERRIKKMRNYDLYSPKTFHLFFCVVIFHGNDPHQMNSSHQMNNC